MSGGTCGCSTRPCGCCDGVAQQTPAAIHNRPGLDALAYRAGTHAQFFETMQARLSAIRVDGLGPDGQTTQTWRPLQALTTRDRSDLSIALLDGWATVADVLTFYQERIANEGFLRTATERRSVLELAHLVGYTLRPGVAATVYLAYTLDDHQADSTTIAAGARSQSMPGPGESTQTFETSEDLVARAAWNNLQVRTHRPQNLTLDTAPSKNEDLTIDDIFETLRTQRHALAIDTIVVAGVATNLRPGDKLLFVFNNTDSDKNSNKDSDDNIRAIVRSVVAIDTQFTDQRTAIKLQPAERAVVACATLVMDCIVQLQRLLQNNNTTNNTTDIQSAIHVAMGILTDVGLEQPSHPSLWTKAIRDALSETAGGAYNVILDLGNRINLLLTPSDARDATVTEPGSFIKKLLIPAVPQAANSLNLPRDLATSFALKSPASLMTKSSRASRGVASPPPQADASSQLLVHFAPVLRDTFYRAWSGATVNAAVPSLRNVYALRARTTLFGAGAPKIPTYAKDPEGNFTGQLEPQNKWDDWEYANDETDNNAFLDQSNEAITPGSYVLVHVGSHAPPTTDGAVAEPVPQRRQVLRVSQVSVVPRSEYGLSGPSTMLVFNDHLHWRTTDSDGTHGDSPSMPPREQITALRKTQIYAQSEPLTLVDEPITDPVTGPQIELGDLYNELKSGRWVILSGERADIPQVSGVQAAELMMVSSLHHSFDPDLPGDQTHTTLILATPLAYHYKRDTLKIYGNVVKATHGETRNEVLGSGDGAQPLQSFTLKQPPLTFVAAPTAAGAESTLHVYVDNVEWHETDSLAGLRPADHYFVTATDDAGNTQVTFGNGVQGARLPTGVQNVIATYRNGIGAGGNVKAQQVSILTTRPLGVMSVINPLGASGGADKESRDLARENVPLSVMPLDRLVSVADYADFTRSFAGIAKAIAQRVSDGRRQLIYLTIAGVDDILIDPSSDLYRNLLAAFRKLGDRDVPVQFDRRELTALVLSAGVKLLPDFTWEPVATALRARLLDAFGFGKRALGQPALRCEVLSVMQAVRGVAYVDIDVFGGVTEKTLDRKTKTRVLRGPDEITHAVQRILKRTVHGRFTDDRVDAFPGGIDHGVIRPAELVIFTPAVPDTLILNQLP